LRASQTVGDNDHLAACRRFRGNARRRSWPSWPRWSSRSPPTCALLGTSSFLDRLRRTGPLTPARVREHDAFGPIGKASGFADDARLTRPYDGYAELAPAPPGTHSACDALAQSAG
jgi:hypothetical protein